MDNLRHWYKRPPFWEGVASAFDLFGVSGISVDGLKEIVSEKRRYKAIKDTLLACPENISPMFPLQ